MRSIFVAFAVTLAVAAPVAAAGTNINPATTTVTSISVEWMATGSVVFQVANPWSGCPTYTDGVSVYAQFASNAAGNNAMYAAITAALLSGRTVVIGFHLTQAAAPALCAVDWVQLH